MKIRVTINGGPVNVHHQFGLICNPFPQIPKYEYSAANRMLQALDSDPLESTDQIRTILSGCDLEFIELCCKHFELGNRTSFVVEFPE